MRSRKNGGIIGSRNDIQSQSISGVYTNDDIVITNTSSDIAQVTQEGSKIARWLGAGVDPYYDTVVCQFGDALSNSHILQDQSGNHWEDWQEAAYNYNPTVTEFGPAYTDWSSFFSEDAFYQVKDTADMQFGTGAFTIECWIKPMRQNNGSNVYLMGRGNTSGVTAGSGWTVFLNSSQQVGFYDALGNKTIQHTTTLTLDTWTHIAVVRANTSSNGVQIYVNGAANNGTGTVSSNYADTNTWWYIGRDRVNTSASSGSSATQFCGRMTDIRIVKSAVYTSTFTPPTSNLNMTIANTVYSFSSTIPYHDNIKPLQLQGKTVSRSGYGGTPASNGNASSLTRVLDSPYNPNGSTKYYGNGYHSAFCVDTNRYEITYDVNPSKSLKFNANNFTIEAYVCTVTGVSRAIAGKGTGAQNSGTGWTFFIDGNGSLVWWDGNSSYTSNTSIGTQVQGCGWYHVAAVRSSTTANGFNMFINGVNVYSGTLAANYNDSNPLLIFADRNYGNTFKGHVSCLRISTTARYTGTTTNGTVVFTPSIANTTIVDANTLYLTCAQGNTVPSQTYSNWTDRGWHRLPLQPNRGTPTMGGFSAINRTGYSWQMPNGGEYNRMKATSSNGSFDFGTGDFSVEFWACNKWMNRAYSSGEIQGFIDTRNSFTDNGFCIRYSAVYNSLDVIANGYYLNGSNGGYPIMTASNIEFGFREWVHVCLQRTSGKLALYVNGKLNQETTYTQSLSSGSGFMTIGNFSYPNLQYTQGWYGWMCDIRVLKGSSAYGINGINPEYIQLPKSNLTKLANTVLLCANSPNIADNSGVNFVSWPRGEGDDTTAWNIYASNYTPYSSVEFAGVANTNYLMADIYDSSNPGYYSSGGSNDGNNARLDVSFIQRMASPWTIECFVWQVQADVKNGATNGREFLRTASGGGQEGFRIVAGENDGRVDQSPGNNYNSMKFDLWGYDWNNNVTYQSLFVGDDQTLQSHCWNHIAIVYDPTQPSANQVAMFINGKKKISRSAFTPSYRPGSYYPVQATSYTSGCRISNSARYNNSNTTITIPTTMWTYDANTAMLTNFESPFMDRVSKCPSLWYRPGVSTTYKKFGNGSIKFMNRNFNSAVISQITDRIDIVAGNWSDTVMDFRIYDFTIEGWACWKDATAGGKAFSNGNTGSTPGSALWGYANNMRVGIDINGKWQMLQVSSGSSINQTVTSNVVVSTVTSGAAFDHVVMMRRKGNFIFYVNGQEIGQLSQNFMGQYGSPAYPVGMWNADFYSSPLLRVGSEWSVNTDQAWCGYLQDFRVSAMARYDTRVINGVSTMVFQGTNTPALPVISKAPHPTKGY